MKLDFFAIEANIKERSLQFPYHFAYCASSKFYIQLNMAITFQYNNITEI